jgi:hypothetical protein
MAVSVERTDNEFVIKLPLTVNPIDIQKVLEYFQFIDVVSRSTATTDDIEGLSKEVKAGWSKEMKEKLSQLDEFKDVLE